MTRDWDARTYDRVAVPMTRWGSIVLDRLPLAGDERVLDAGCGSGRVTEMLAERLPPEDRDAFVDEVVARLPGTTIDYVRLNILATRRRD